MTTASNPDPKKFSRQVVFYWTQAKTPMSCLGCGLPTFLRWWAELNGERLAPDLPDVEKCEACMKTTIEAFREETGSTRLMATNVHATDKPADDVGLS